MEAPSSRAALAESHRPYRNQWRVNWRLLIMTLVAVAVLAPAAYFWHDYQLRRNGSAFLKRAERLESEERWAEAAEDLYRYLQLFPDDSEARIRLATVYDRRATTSQQKLRAIDLYYSAIGLAPERDDLVRRQAELLLEAQRYSAALDQANRLLQMAPTDFAGLRVRALASYAQAAARGRVSQDNVEAFRLAIAHGRGKPEQIALYAALARIYRHDLTEPGQQKRAEIADELMDQMIEANAEQSGAWLARFRYRRQYNLPGAEQDLREALNRSEDEPRFDIELAAAAWEQEQGHFDEAVAHYRRAIELGPNDVRCYLGLAKVHTARRDSAAAIEVLEEGVGQVGMQSGLELKFPLVDILLADGNLDQADAVLAAMGEQVELTAARAPGPAANQLRGRFEYLRSQLHMARGEYAEAASILRRLLTLQPNISTATQSIGRVDLFLQLGQCYTQLRQADRAAVAYEEAAALRPEEVGPRLAAATAWQSAGRLDEAVRQFRQAVLLPDAPVQAWMSLAELMLQQELGVDAARRDWQPLKSVLADARRMHPNAAALQRLNDQLQRLWGEAGDDAEIEAFELTDEELQSPLTVQRLVMTHEGAGNHDAADRVLRRFEEAGTDPIAAGLMRATLMSDRGQYAAAEQLLHQTLEQHADAPQAVFQLRLALLNVRTGKIGEARQRLRQLAEEDPYDALPIQLLADLALEARDFDELRALEDELRRREGEDGTAWRFYRAQRLLAQSTEPQDRRLDEVERMAQEIRRLRPSWASGVMLEAQLAQKRGDISEAIDLYRQAIDLGEQRLYVFEQLTRLLFVMDRREEAGRYLTQLGLNVVRSRHLAHLAIPLHLQLGDFERAESIARQQAAHRPDDPLSHVWQAQMRLIRGEMEAAEADLRRAVELAPQDVRTWQLLFTHLAQVGDEEAAREVLHAMVEQAEMTPGQREVVLGQGYDALGEAELAASHFHEAIAIGADEPDVHRQIAQFFQTHDVQRAEQALRRVLELVPDNLEDRRRLASFLIERGDPPRLAEAERILDEHLAADEVDPADRRLQAQLLLRRGREGDAGLARQVLEEMLDGGETDSADRLLLAQVCEAQGDIDEAERHYRHLVERDPPELEHLALLIDLLLRHERAERAERWLDLLDQLEPDGWRAIALRARWLAAGDQVSEVKPSVEAWLSKRLELAASDDERCDLLQQVGDLYSQLRMHREAERCYRQVVEKMPQRMPTLVVWLARRGRLSEAIDLFVAQAAEDTAPEYAVALVQALILGRAGPAEVKRVEPLLNDALKKHNDHQELVFTLATWRLLRGEQEEAVRLLRRVLQLDTRNVTAMNNLALALSERSDGLPEALELIDRAIDLSAPSAELLDTKATILLRDRQVEAAVEILNQIVAQAAPDPRHCLHLALAHHALGNLEEARQALARARERFLDVSLLSPSERDELARLEDELSSQGVD